MIKRERAIEITGFLLRFMAALMFIQAGGMKLFDWFGGIPAEYGGHPARFNLIWWAGFLEVYGGAAILLGLFTRPVAFLLSGEMAFAYFIASFPKGFWPIQSHGEIAVMYCFYFLFLSAYGGGKYSLDATFSRRA